MGGRPRWQSVTPRVLSGRDIARRAHPRRHVAGAGPLSGEGRAGPVSAGPVSAGLNFQSGPLQSGPFQHVKLAEPPADTGEYPSSALLGAPVGHGRGRQSPDQARDMAAELASWTSGELPGQVTEQLASWPPGLPSAAASRRPARKRRHVATVRSPHSLDKRVHSCVLALFKNQAA